MKLMLILLCLNFHVSAIAYSQKVTVTFNHTPVWDALRIIRQQTGYDFMIDQNQLNASHPVTLSLKNATIEETLQALFAGQPFEYRIEKKLIQIRRKGIEKKGESEDALKLQSPQQKLNGIVRDEEGNPLPGATVMLKEQNNRVSVSDAEGRFWFSNVPAQGTLVVRMIGRETKEVKYSGEINLSIILKAINTDLDVMVVKGYYNTTKTLNTGSVGTLTAADIAKQPVSDPLMALAGRIPGIYVAQTSGVAGASVAVNIRGQNSISNGNDPLYIIDGVPFNNKSLSQTENAAYSDISPFVNIRPSDIESIDVLKDADATAIYGSRGANGVILITTKKGTSGKAKFDVNVYAGEGKVTSKLKLMNTAQYLEMRDEAHTNENFSPFSFEYDINGTWDRSRYTDWQKIFVGGTAKVYDVRTSISGGNELTRYLFGLGYRRESSVFPGDFANRIISSNINLQHQSLNKRFKLDLSSLFTKNNNQLPSKDLLTYIFLAPNAPALYNSDGELNWENNTFDNPMAYTLQRNTSISDNFLNSLNLSYDIIPGLNLKSSFGYNAMSMNDRTVVPYSSIKPSNTPSEDWRSLGLGYNKVESWIIEPQLNYTKNIGNHHISALVASTFQTTTQNGTTINSSGYSSDVLLENTAAATRTTSSSNYSQYRYTAIFSRIGYNYKEKYVINLTGRRDGSSRFGSGKRFGNFGAIGAAWVFSNENFVKYKLSPLSYGKIRASIGKTGNDQISDYRYLSTYYPSDGYYGNTGLNPGNLANTEYRWETINKIEAAIELGFIKNRILLNTSIYRNRTSNQLVGYSLPSLTGFDNIIANLPAVIQNKGFELDLTTINVKTNDFSWTTRANISIPRNRLISYPGLESSSYKNTYAIGYPLSVRHVLKYTGIDPNTGLYTFEDRNHDGVINTSTDKYFQNSERKFFGGFSNTFTYKGFSMDVFFQFVKQDGYRYVGFVSPGTFTTTGSNMPVEFLDRWTEANKGLPVTVKYQRYTANYGQGYISHIYYRNSDAITTDASFIRLKNLSLSYSLPETWLKRLNIRNARISLQGQNLLTITKFHSADPENSSAGFPVLPPIKFFTAGLQVSL